MVTHLWVTVADNEFAWSRLVRVRVYYDGRKTPSVDAPLGDFFGVGHGYERDLSTMMVRNSSFGRARNAYWPMPFRKACHITVTNEGVRLGARLTGCRWHVPDPIPFSRSLWAGIEHAGWTYNPDGTVRAGFEERPDFFSSVAFWYQTGVNEDLAEPPYGDARLPLGNAEQIAVEKSIDDVTTTGGTASVQLEVDWAKNLLAFEAAGRGSRINIPIDVRETGQYEIIVAMAQAPNYGDYVALLDDGPTNIDSRKPATSEIPATGPEVFHNYLPEMYVARDQPLGWFQLTKGRHVLSFVCVGKDERSAGYNLGINSAVLEKVPTVEKAVTDVRTEDEARPAATGAVVYRGRQLSYYTDKLKDAPASARADLLRAVGAFGPDAEPAIPVLTAALGESEPDVRAAAAWALSQLGTGGVSAVPALAKALADSSARVRDLAAVALRNIGPQAADAVPDLIRALDDPVDYVRFPVADAIGAIGPAASAAVPALTKRFLAKGESGLVLNRVALALGAIGPLAKSALPVLERAITANRLGAAAREAVLRIQGKPVPTWW
jgi:hypothetical protein